MKNRTPAPLLPVFVLVFSLLFLGCRAPDAAQVPASVPVPVPVPVPVLPSSELLKTEGCKVHKTKGILKVECADGSFAEAGVPTYHIRSADGTDLENLMFLQNWSQVGVLAINKRSGNILSYGASGEVTKITRTLFESGDCSGTAYAFFSDFVVKNKVMSNDGAAPSSFEALRVVGYEPTVKTYFSRFEGGSCQSWSGSAGGASIVEPTQFDDTDPVVIGLPIEIVFEQ